MKSIWRLLELVPRYKSRVVKAVLVNSMLGLVGLATPYLLKVVLDLIIGAVDGGVSPKSTEMIAVGLAILVGVSLLGVIFDYVGERLSDFLFLDILTEIRKKVFHHLSKLSIDYYERTRSGEIMERINTGTVSLARWTSLLSDGFLGVLITIVLATIFLWVHIPWVGFIITVAVPLNFYLVMRSLAQTKPIREQYSKHAERGTGEMAETLSQISTVRSFGQERERLNRYAEQTEQYRSLRVDQSVIQWRTNALRGVLNIVTFIGSLGVVAWGIVHGHNTVGDVLMVSLYVQQIRGNIMPLSRIMAETGDAETAAGRLLTILDAEATVIDRTGAIELQELESIEFQNVSFQYPGKTKKILKDISFQLTKGQTLALVGPSGVGKSTITKLVLRFYEPTSGQILINGQPIETFTQNSIRRSLGMVMQDVTLFNDTIKENLRFAAPKATDTAIIEAAQIAHADEFIEKFTDQYETLVGERGIKLSGGEKQRVAIARAILRNPQLVILDEATSALDSKSERYVQDGLQKLLKNKTAIIIAHRLSTVMRSDSILVLQNGSVLEQGNHQQLLKKKGLYAKLFSMQSDSLKSFDLTTDSPSKKS